MAGKVLDIPDLCSIRLGKDMLNSREFVAVLSNEDGVAELYYSADALTLGMSMKLIAGVFSKHIDECSKEDRDAVLDILDLRDWSVVNE